MESHLTVLLNKGTHTNKQAQLYEGNLDTGYFNLVWKPGSAYPEVLTEIESLRSLAE